MEDHGYRIIHKDEIQQLRAEVEHLKAENTAVWDAITNMADYLTAEQIDTELRRQGIDTAKAFGRLRAALRARKEG